jgi:hypothetical protein
MNDRRPIASRVVAVTLLMLTLLAGAAPALDGSLEDDCQGERASCLACAIFCRYSEVLAEARIEVGALDNGIVLHYTADDPTQILDLQRYAYEREKLFRRLGDEKILNQLCERCRLKAKAIAGAHFETANSAHGVFSVLTSDDPAIVRALHQMGSAVTMENDVRGS